MTLRAALLLSVACAPMAATAQSAIELDEAFVFSNLLQVEVGRTGTTIEVLEFAESDTAPQAVDETLARLPGVSVTSNGGLGTTSTVRIRGLSDIYTGVTFNGIEITDPSGTQNRFDFGQLARGSVDRIEVAKGSQTTIYGSDAIAGAINITTWRPREDGVSGRATLEAGSYGTVAGSLNFGILDEDTEIAVTLSRTQSDGFSARVENDEEDGFRQTLLSFSAEQRVGEAVTLGGTAFFVDEYADYDGFTPTDPIGASDGQRRGARVFARLDGERIDHEFGVSLYNRKRDEISSFGPFPFEGERLKVDYLGTTDLTGGGRLAFGADWTEEKAEVGGPPGFEDTNQAVFAEWQQPVSEATDVSVSLRHDFYSDFDDVTTGRVAVSFRPDAATTIRASVGNGYRAPSLYERFDSFAGNPDLVPEESIGGEIGIERQFDDGFVRATAFRTDIDNLIEYDFTSFAYVQSDVERVAQGVELAGEITVGSALFFGNYTYTDAKDGDAEAIRVPRHDLSLGVEMPLGEASRIAADLLYVSDRVDFGGPMDDYTVVNATLSREIAPGQVAYLRVENLFDESYESIPGYNTAGRSFFAGLRAEF